MINPLRDGILVKPYEISEFSKGGIYQGQPTTTFVANKAKEVQTTVGKVVRVGKGKYNGDGNLEPVKIAIGKYVVFSDTCGKPVNDNNEKYLIISEQDVIGFVEEPTDVELIYEN